MAIFSDKDQKIKAEDAQTVIGAGVKVEGTFVAFGNVIVKGQVSGTLETKNDLHLEEGAVVDGDITAKNAYLAGEIKGNVKAEERAVLDKGARLNGDLDCRVLSIEAGAVFNGRCAMGGEAKLKETEEE
jgi:cytoskeletal protein CcmA (bactofilin family)